MPTARPVLPDTEVRRICVIRLRRMGDIVLMTPCLRALRRWRPSAAITVVVDRPFDELLVTNENVDEVVALPRRRLRSLLRTAQQLRRRRFDLVLNFHGGSRSALLTVATGARWRVGERRFHYRFAYHVVIDPEEGIDEGEALHTIERQMRFLEALGIPPAALEPEVLVEAAARERMRKRLARLKISHDAPFVLLRPSAVHKAKQWPPERFAAIADWLAEEHGQQCVIDVGPGEEETAVAFEKAARRKHPRVEAPTPHDLVALIEAAGLVVANDSGPTHIAAALGKPVVVIFGGSNPDRWRPWSERARVVHHPLECSPCPLYECTNPERYLCLRAVQVGAVQAAIDDLLASEARRASTGAAAAR